MKVSFSEEKYAPIFILIAALCWSLCGVFVKSSTWSGLSIAILRGSITCFVYLLILGRVRIRLTKMKVVIAVCMFMQSILFMTANKFTTAGSVTALQNTSPIYIIILNSIMIRRRPSWGDIIECLCLLLGIFITVMGGSMGSNMLGNAMALLSGVFYGCMFFLSSVSQMDTLESLVLGNALYLPLLPIMFSEPVVLAGGLSGWIIPILCSLICGTIAWLFFRAGIKHCTSLEANFIAMIEPVTSPLWTLIFLGERMSLMSVAGCAIVIGTLMYFSRQKHG